MPKIEEFYLEKGMVNFTDKKVNMHCKIYNEAIVFVSIFN